MPEIARELHEVGDELALRHPLGRGADFSAHAGRQAGRFVPRENRVIAHIIWHAARDRAERGTA
jgi:hypothetical protein